MMVKCNKLVAFFHASEIQRGFRKNVNESLKIKKPRRADPSICRLVGSAEPKNEVIDKKRRLCVSQVGMGKKQRRINPPKNCFFTKHAVVFP